MLMSGGGGLTPTPRATLFIEYNRIKQFLVASYPNGIWISEKQISSNQTKWLEQVENKEVSREDKIVEQMKHRYNRFLTVDSRKSLEMRNFGIIRLWSGRSCCTLWAFGNPMCHLWSLSWYEVEPFLIQQLGLMESLYLRQKWDWRSHMRSTQYKNKE